MTWKDAEQDQYRIGTCIYKLASVLLNWFLKPSQTSGFIFTLGFRPLLISDQSLCECVLCVCGWVGTHKVCVCVHARWRKREKERRNLKGNGNFDFFGRKNRNKTWKQLVRLRPLMCGTDSVDPEANQKWTTRSYFLHDLADYWEANGLGWHMVLS